MRKSFVALLLVIGAASSAMPVFAALDGTDDFPARLANGKADEMRSRAARLGTSTHTDNDSTFVGYNPAFASSNYWSVGTGHRRPRGTFGPAPGDIVAVPNDDTGYWDWDHPVHGDTLQGWWPMRHQYTGTGGLTLPDYDRPWWAIDIGNSVSYVINQGPGFRRTFGVTSAWHEDPGVLGKTSDPAPIKTDVNPNPPRWSPIAGGMSAWCGLRAHGDITQIDGVTGNPYNEDALGEVTQTSSAAGWVSTKFPGYASQWDQMLYRDVDISGANPSANVSVSFKFRTRMSTGKVTTAATRTGWFDKDPLSVHAAAAGDDNFISSTDAGDTDAPIDSFMVYVGAPVGDNAGADWLGSDGLTHDVFDPVRRWFGELIKANEPGGHYEVYTTFGNNPALAVPADSNAFNSVTVTRNVTYGTLQANAAWGNKIRLVFRVKTNRAFSDDTGSLTSGATYNSGYLGAAQVDDVSIDLGAGPVAISGGDFESKGDINNHWDYDGTPDSTALEFWKTSSKPPAIIHHVHDLQDLIYQDLCGAPGVFTRQCDLAGGVVSHGDHDLGEAFNGPAGTPEREQYQGITSPTINLAFDPGSPTAKNNMGLDADTAVPTGSWRAVYNLYHGGYNLFLQGSGFQWYAKCYPATQSDGTRTWTNIRFATYQEFWPDKLCRDYWHDFLLNGQIRTTNADGQPDSIRIGMRRIAQCYRFGITTGCATTLGGYWDNVSLLLLDGTPQPLSVDIWELWNDTFPANESPGLPGLAAFDTTVALIGGGLNKAQTTGDLERFVVPGDTILVNATGDGTELQLKFRIWPGPGNYVIPGDPCSGLSKDPARNGGSMYPVDTSEVAWRITPGDGTFWTEYILNTGKDKDDMPTTGDCKGGGPLRHDQRWSELVWCNARMDTAEQNLFPIEARNINSPLGAGVYATMYEESDKHLAALGIPRHKCFLIDTLGGVIQSNITCSSVPAWVTEGGAPYRTGYDGNAFTVEGTKIIPDGLLTPGSHVQYFFEKKELGVFSAMVPDTNLVYPQDGEGSFDGHRWQQFSVLPDAWKFPSYGGLQKACMLYVDMEDRWGGELVWVSVADSIGATSAARRGAHNGWTGPSKVDLDDPAYFVNKNCQPGTTWDMYGVKAAESLNSQAGGFGARYGHRGTPSLLDGKWAKNGPTEEMLGAYYRILNVVTGSLLTYALFGPLDDKSADDAFLFQQYALGATANDHRGLFFSGDGLIEDVTDGGGGYPTIPNLLSVSLRHTTFGTVSGNTRICIDLIPTSIITTNEDIYGYRLVCSQTADVLDAVGDGVPAMYYDPVGSNPVGAPYIASVFTDAEPAGNPNNHWQSLMDSWDLWLMRSRGCDKTYGRLLYFWNVFTNAFGKLCAVAGTAAQTVEVPNNPEGRTFVEFAGQNPLRQGTAEIRFSLAKDDRVTAKIYDVSGRLVRTLADGQMFKAKEYSLHWDGLDNGGRNVARGVYFVHVKLHNSAIDRSRKMIVLK